MLKTPAHYRPGLDLVRLAALLPVLCYHFCIEAARSGFAVPAALIGRGMADWVEVGLAWFFLLSGAALCLQWQGRFAWRPYLAGRAAAMYPAFWLGFAVLFLYGEVLHGNNPDVPRWRVVFSVLGLDGYLAPLTATFYKIGEWFLGVILLLYLLFPLLLWCMDARTRRRGLLAAMLLLQLAWPFVCPAPLEAGHTVLGRLPAFALGVWFGMRLRAGGDIWLYPQDAFPRADHTSDAAIYYMQKAAKNILFAEASSSRINGLRALDGSAVRVGVTVYTWQWLTAFCTVLVLGLGGVGVWLLVKPKKEKRQ